ncbi:hypothetical protein IV203_037552 [Nitzschia inconspicua]|uniref:DUF6824 domain-containing protein n=1 Tax=Nitzschia inconspicua TaxID=303405 RepID=A0A9K3LM37_9STRA|nr:hypothetical protein IV203_037552 [Nitzschia inconspicua]
MTDNVDTNGGWMDRLAVLMGTRSPAVALEPEIADISVLGLSSSDRNFLTTSLDDLSFASFEGDLSGKDLAIFQSQDEGQRLHIEMNISTNEANNTKCPNSFSGELSQKTDWNTMYRKAVTGSTSRESLNTTYGYASQVDTSTLHKGEPWKMPTSFLSMGKVAESSHSLAFSPNAKEQSKGQWSFEALNSTDPHLTLAASVGTTSPLATGFYANEGHLHTYEDIFGSNNIKSQYVDIQLQEGPLQHEFQELYNAKCNMFAEGSAEVEDDRKPGASGNVGKTQPTAAIDEVNQDSGASKKRRRQFQPAVKVYVEEIAESDVLMGRGGRSNRHVGNLLYLKKIGETKPLYAKCRLKSEKTKVAQSVVDYVKNEQKGRFVELEKESGRWYVADDKAARTKAGQALRDVNTPEARARKREKYGC